MIKINSYSNLKETLLYYLTTAFSFTSCWDLFMKLFMGLLLYFVAIKTYFIVVLVLILIDLITGIRAAIKDGHKITSCGFRKTLDKFLAYSTTIIAAHIFELTFLPFAKLGLIVCGFIATTELYSIMENANKITGTNIKDYVKDILDKFLGKNKESK